MEPLVAPGEFATYLQRTPDEPHATQALTGASGVVRHFCRWVVSEEKDVTFTVDGTGTNLLSLPTLRLNEVTAVRVRGAVVTGYEWSSNGQIQTWGLWPRRFRSVEVDCSHGYADVPDEIRAVVMALAARYYINPEGLRSKTVGSVSRTYGESPGAGDLTALETVLIGGYRLP